MDRIYLGKNGVKRMNNKLYMITVNNKKFDEWAKRQKIKLRGERMKQH